MDIKSLYRTKHWLDYSSFTLNTEYYVILSNSLLVLQNENHFTKMFFWGIIHGVDTDYYIAFGYKADAITERKFFYSFDCQNWKLCPSPTREHIILTELCRKPFQGDPGLVMEIVDDSPKENLLMVDNISVLENVVEDQSEETEVKDDLRASQMREIDNESSIRSGNLKEEDRLSAIIYIISEETSIIPRGGLFKQTDGVNVHSLAFEGLSLDDADEINSFQHYRVPRQDWNTNLLMRVDYNYAIDFLDTIDKDIPKDSWTAQLLEGDRAIILRNLHWPGFTFFHHLYTSEYGFIYNGIGQRNLDIPFMTQVYNLIKIDVESKIDEKTSNLQSESKKSISKSSDQEIQSEVQFNMEETNVPKTIDPENVAPENPDANEP